MRLTRFSQNGGRPRAGVVVGDEVVDLHRHLGAAVTVEDLLGRGDEGRTEVGRVIASEADRFGLAEVKLHAPIARPPKFLAVGLNYHAHSVESARVGVDRPDAAVIFNKQSTCVTGPYDPIEKPTISDLLDYEGELAFVIGRRCRRVRAADAHEVIAGYLIINDVSVRDWQRASPTMTMGKSWDTHGPMGPWVTTADEVPDPHRLRLQTWVNGDLRQDSNTRLLLRNCFELVEHISTVCTLELGDVIATGTPEGVGVAMEPPCMLEVGDVVRVAIEGLGAIENPVVNDEMAAAGEAA